MCKIIIGIIGKIFLHKTTSPLAAGSESDSFQTISNSPSDNHNNL
jgi:hypothetical protein